MSLPFNNILQVNMSIHVLNVNTPARGFIDIRTIDGLLDTLYFMQSCFWKFSGSVALVVFKFCQSFKKKTLNSSFGKIFIAS